MKFNQNYLLSPIFILSLLLLLSNDFFLKYTFHNDLTGKLSDFAGVIVLLFFLHFLNDRRRLLNASVVALFFIYWKSPLSGGFISFWNDLGMYQIARVVDYWDLMALLLLPVLTYAEVKDRTIKFRSVLSSILAMLTVFALCSTSRQDSVTGWRYNYHNVVYEFTTKLQLHEFVETMEQQDNMHYSRQDSLIVQGERMNSYLFIGDTSKGSILDSCRFTYAKKSEHKLKIQIISAGIGSVESLLKLDLPDCIKRYKLSSKVTSFGGTIIWIK